MPFVRTAVRRGTDVSQKQLIVESIHNALVQAIGMPEDELFNLVSEYNASDFLYSRTFNGVARSDHLVVVEITMRRGRSDAMKKALYAEIAANLEKRQRYPQRGDVQVAGVTYWREAGHVVPLGRAA